MLARERDRLPVQPSKQPRPRKGPIALDGAGRDVQRRRRLVHAQPRKETEPDDLGLRPIYHQLEQRIEAHIFVAFIAYCLHVTLRAWLKPLAGGLTPRAVLDKLAAVQMLDVHFPTTDGRTLIFSRYTVPDKLQKLLLAQLALELPAQSPPRITSKRTIEPFN